MNFKSLFPKQYCIDCKRRIKKVSVSGKDEAIEFEDGWRCPECAERKVLR